MFADDEYDPDEAEEIVQAIKKEGRRGLFFNIVPNFFLEI